jgi:hypothetical protein
MNEPIRTIKNLMLNNFNNKFVFIDEEHNDAEIWEKREIVYINDDTEFNRDDEFDDDARLFDYIYYKFNYDTQSESESDDELNIKDLNGSVLD